MATKVRLYGTTELIDDDSSTAVGRAKERAVFAYLATRPGQLVTHDALLDAFWADQHPDDAIRSLRVRVANLRKVCSMLDIGIDVRPSGYVLDVAQSEVDAFAYRELVTAAREMHGESRLERLEAAEKLRVGTLLSEFVYEDFARELIATDELVRRMATGLKAEAAMENGRYEAVVALCSDALERDTTDESAAVMLARCLALLGRTGDAIATMSNLRVALAERGLVLSAKSLAIEDAVLLDRTDMLLPASRRLPVRPVLFGRDRELTMLHDLLEGGHSISVTGPPGVGKSALVIELAHRLAQSGADVGVADLSTVDSATETSSIIASVTGAMGDTFTPGGRVLVLDNCDRALGVVSSALADPAIIERDLTVITTSRRALMSAGVRRLSIGPLAVPTPHDALSEESEAVLLFLSMARERLPGYEPSPPDLDAIRELVRKLDGLPLAMDLAAARLAVLSPAQILDRVGRVDGVLADRQATSRYPSMLDAVRWTTETLSDDARKLLGVVSVFRGTFDLAAIEAVARPYLDAQSVLDALHELERHSLVTVDLETSPRQYRLLGVIADHAAASLTDDDTAEIRDRHRRHYRDRCRVALRAPVEERLAAFELIIGNVRAAIEGALRRSPEQAAELLVLTFDWWHRRGRWDDGAAIGATIEAIAVPGDPALRRRFYSSLARLTLFSSDHAPLERYLDLADGLAAVLDTLPELRVRALACRTAGELEAAIELHHSSVAECRERGLPAAADLANIAECNIALGRIGAARDAADAAIDELTERSGRDPVHVTRAEIAMVAGDHHGAMTRAAHWLEASGSTDDAFAAHALIVWTLSALRLGRREVVIDRMPELLRLGGRLGAHHLRNVLLTAASLAQAAGRPAEASAIASAAAAMGVPADRPWERELVETLAREGGETVDPLEALKRAHLLVRQSDR